MLKVFFRWLPWKTAAEKLPRKNCCGKTAAGKLPWENCRRKTATKNCLFPLIFIKDDCGKHAQPGKPSYINYIFTPFSRLKPMVFSMKSIFVTMSLLQTNLRTQLLLAIGQYLARRLSQNQKEQIGLSLNENEEKLLLKILCQKMPSKNF